MYAVVTVIAHMVNAHLYPFVSLLIAPITATHGVYYNVNAINENTDNGVNEV